MSLDKVRLGLNDYKYAMKTGEKASGDYRPPELMFRETEKVKNEYIERILNDSITKLKDAANIFSRRLSFSVDKKTNRVIVKVIDTETDKVIREIPPEQVVELAAKIQEMIGLLVDEER